MKKFRFWMSLMVALAIILSSFSGINVAQAADKDTLVIATFSDPIDLCPSLSSDSASSDVTGYLFRGLLKYDWNTNFIPDLAAELPKVSADNKTITFKLKKDLKWDDGQPLTSADVKFSYEFILDKNTGSPRYGEFEKIASIETPDDLTVVIKLNEPDAALYECFGYNYIIPKHIWEKVDRSKAKMAEANKKPVGCGPYKFVEWKPAERVVLTANPYYHDKKPNIKNITMIITGNQAAGMIKAETNEADYVVIPESDIARMKTKSNLNTYVYDRAAFDCILYNLKTEFFSDKRVRQAFSHAINKAAIVNGIYKGVAKVAEGSYHPKLWSYSANVPKYTYNVAKAKQLLDQAGWKVGSDGIRVKNGKKFSIVMLTNKGNIMREKALVAIQTQLRLVGVKVEPRILEWNTFLNKYVDVGKFDAYVGGFSTSLDGDQTAFYHSNKEIAPFNKGGYANKKVDELLDEGRKTFNLAERKKIYAEVQKLVAEDLPMTYLCYRKSAVVVNKRVANTKFVDILGANDGLMDWTLTK